MIINFCRITFDHGQVIIAEEEMERFVFTVEPDDNIHILNGSVSFVRSDDTEYIKSKVTTSLIRLTPDRVLQFDNYLSFKMNVGHLIPTVKKNHLSFVAHNGHEEISIDSSVDRIHVKLDDIEIATCDGTFIILQLSGKYIKSFSSQPVCLQ